MKALTGKVVSNKMNKTVIVEIERTKFHPLYKKIIRRSKKYKAHSEDASIKVGDVVTIAQTRPVSKEKHYSVVKQTA